MKSPLRLVLTLAALALMTSLAATTLLFVPGSASAQPPGTLQLLGSEVVGWGLIAAALATGLSALAAGIAVARVGTAAVGALAEKPELFGRLLIMIGIAEGIAIYGLIISILILNRLA